MSTSEPPKIAEENQHQASALPEWHEPDIAVETSDQSVLQTATLSFLGNVNIADRIVKEKFGEAHGSSDLLYVHGTTPSGEATREIKDITRLEAVFGLGNSRIIIQSKADKWGEWDEPHLVHLVPFGASAVPWPVDVDLATAWNTIQSRQIHREALLMVSLSKPLVSPQHHRGPRYDFRFADGKHVFINAEVGKQTKEKDQ